MKDKLDLLSMTIEELEALLLETGHKKFHAKQIFQWTHKGIKDIDGMTNLSKELRNQLKEIAYINRLEIVKKLVSNIDGTVKYLFKLIDGSVIESVLMKYQHGYSVCISSQVGC
ncbi:MAG TPA: 23S rRNA (adenine(2503)-C(2))-methyltransferase RlmN, partial [Acetivibrio sp.]|nr:23S rRNA (adenine(2503)-C(2))-methyltransferase RlmN [Acetivibrio sp.]